MEARFNVIKEGRKALVRAVSEATGQDAVYQGAPGFAFAVGDYIIDRYGTLICGGRISAVDVRSLLTGLAERGFAFEGDIDEIAPIAQGDTEAEPDGLTNREVISEGGIDGTAPVVSEQAVAVSDGSGGEESDRDGDGENGGIGGESEPDASAEAAAAAICAPDGDSGKLAIHMPLSGFTPSAQGNVENLVAAKAWILRKMAETDALPVERDDRHLRFPWFKPEATAVEIDAYSRLIAGMCETAKTKKRVTSSERQLEDGDNEKFKARCFLLSIGFIGEEYKQARKVLLSPFSGNGSHKAGSGKKAAPEAVTTADNGGEPVEAACVREDGSCADMPLKCGECPHHSYYTDGQSLASAGGIVDTSNRAPEKYAHYCLNAPSGFRKIKHATDWSGCENAPKWCPLFIGDKAATAADNGGESALAIHALEDGFGAGNAQTGGEGAADYE